MCNDNIKHALLPISSYLCSTIDEYYMREGEWDGKGENYCEKNFIDFYYFFVPCSIIVDTIIIPYNMYIFCDKQNKVSPEI
tara:strand:- start:1307 stop:1549 length:243 start_codon:yes stop_codon:yes gene_type:complete